MPLGSMCIKNSAAFPEWTLRALEALVILRAEKDYLEMRRNC